MSEDLERRLKDFPAHFPRPRDETTRRVEQRARARLAAIRGRRRTRAAAGGFTLTAALAASVVIGYWDAAASAVRGAGERTAAAAAPTRVIDRTLVCEVGWRAGVYVAKLRAESAHRASKSPASVEVRTSVQPTWRLASVSERGVELSPACRATRARVRLTAEGLVGGPAAQIAEEFDCWTPRRVVLRLRATLRSPVTLRAGRPWGFPLLFARGRVTDGWLALRTQAGKRLVFANVSQSGRARVFTAPRDCFRD